MTIDSHTHVFDCSVAGAEENFPLWPGTRWGASVPDLLHQIDEADIDTALEVVESVMKGRVSVPRT